MNLTAEQILARRQRGATRQPQQVVTGPTSALEARVGAATSGVSRGAPMPRRPAAPVRPAPVPDTTDEDVAAAYQAREFERRARGFGARLAETTTPVPTRPGEPQRAGARGFLAPLDLAYALAQETAAGVVTAGQAVFPGQQEIQRKAAEFRSRGVSPSEAANIAYRTSDLPSARVPVSPVRIPLPGGRSFKGVDVGVKGALELALDPVNLPFAAGPAVRGITTLGRLAAPTLRQAGAAIPQEARVAARQLATGEAGAIRLPGGLTSARIKKFLTPELEAANASAKKRVEALGLEYDALAGTRADEFFLGLYSPGQRRLAQLRGEGKAAVPSTEALSTQLQKDRTFHFKSFGDLNAFLDTGVYRPVSLVSPIRPGPIKPLYEAGKITAQRPRPPEGVTLQPGQRELRERAERRTPEDVERLERERPLVEAAKQKFLAPESPAAAPVRAQPPARPVRPAEPAARTPLALPAAPVARPIALPGAAPVRPIQLGGEGPIQPLPSGRVPGGPRAAPLPPVPPRPPAELPPAPPGGFPSGRVPGGPGRMQPPPPRDPYAQLVSALEPEREPLLNRLRTAIPQEMYDRNYPLKELERVTGIPAHSLAKVVPGSATAGEDIVRRFYLPSVEPLGKDVTYLEQYMTIKRADDVLVRSPSARLPGSLQGYADLAAAEAAILKRIGPQRFTAVQQAAEELWRLNDEQVLQPLLREGIINDELYTALKSSHPHYIPFKRADFTDTLSQSFTRPEANVSSTGIKKMGLEGSERDLDKPLLRLLSEPIKTQGIIARNKAARSIVQALEEQSKASGEELVRYIEPKRELNIAERVTGEFKPRLAKGEHSRIWETISYYEGGAKHTVEVPAIYGRVAKGLEAEPDNIALTIIRALNAPLRLGATTFNPFFLPVNIMRDAMSALFRERLTPFGPQYMAGLWGAIRKNSDFSEAAQSGALLSGIVDTMRSGAPLARARMAGGIQVRNPMDALFLLPNLIKQANILTEQGVRVAVFRKLRAEGLDQLAAAVRTRDATVDFAKAGHAMRVINQIVPFSNAATQGTANIARTIRDHPVRTLALAGLMTTPVFMSRINNMRFETSEMIPDYEYTRNWVVQVGEGERKDGTRFPIYIKIPKGEFVAAFTFPAEAMFSWARASEDRSAVELVLNAAREAGRAVSPVDIEQNIVGLLPPLAQTATGLTTGVDPFTRAPIVPRREQALLPEQQFGPETSPQAVALGQQFKISPRLIDFAIKDYTAGGGQTVNWLLGLGLEAAGYSPQPFGAATAEAGLTSLEAVTRAPVGRLLGTRGTQLERRGWERFDQAAEEGARAFNAIPGMSALGLRLGSVGDSLDMTPGKPGGSVDLTPAERAQYQTEVNAYVVPRMQTLVTRLSANPTYQGWKPDRQRKHLADQLGNMKDVVRNQFRASRASDKAAPAPSIAPVTQPTPSLRERLREAVGTR